MPKTLRSVLADNVFVALHICICCLVAPVSNADLSLPILNCGRNETEKLIGSSTVN